MADVIPVEPRNERELVIGRLLDAAPEAVFRCWTEPQLIVRWFTPPPWKTVEAQVDLRAGGANNVIMEGPDGTRVPNKGVYLELVPGRKLVFTSAFEEAWIPADAGPHGLLFVGELTFEPAEGGRTRYVARAGHFTQAAAQQHREMGFEQGWGVATDQLEAVAKTL